MWVQSLEELNEHFGAYKPLDASRENGKIFYLETVLLTHQMFSPVLSLSLSLCNLFFFFFKLSSGAICMRGIFVCEVPICCAAPPPPWRHSHLLLTSQPRGAAAREPPALDNTLPRCHPATWKDSQVLSRAFTPQTGMSWLRMVWAGEWEVQTTRAMSSFEQGLWFLICLCVTRHVKEKSPCLCLLGIE